MSDPIPGPGNGQTFLGPEQRKQAWERLGSEQFDVVVIGGGVVGAGAALDAATRGLKVALVEARDFASGTSSRSSKMFHGGLRYLEQLEFGLVREALHERELSLTTLAPHLVKPLPFLFPLTNRWWERPYVAAGIFLYDQLGGAKSVPAQKHLLQGGRAAVGARAQAQLADRRHPLLRHRRRRRPAHDDGGAHRGPLRRGGADVDARWSRCCARATGSPASRSATPRTAPSPRCTATSWSTPPACGPTRSRRCPSSAAGSGSARPRACTSWCRATASSARWRSSCAPRSRCCSSSRGARTGSSAPPTPTGTSTSPTPRPPRPTSTTSSSTSTPCWPRRSPTTTSTACTPGCARCWRGRARRRPSCRASTPSRSPRRGWSPSRAASTPPTG